MPNITLPDGKKLDFAKSITGLKIAEKVSKSLMKQALVMSVNGELKDLEYTTDNGHVKGITNIFHNALSNMEENKRPLHCTDLKRETLYIKDNDEWLKDDEKEIIKDKITTVANKNISNTSKWLEKYPDHVDTSSKDFEKYVKMTNNSMGTGDEGEQNKIVKNIMKEVTIEKN